MCASNRAEAEEIAEGKKLLEGFRTIGKGRYSFVFAGNLADTRCGTQAVERNTLPTSNTFGLLWPCGTVATLQQHVRGNFQ